MGSGSLQPLDPNTVSQFVSSTVAALESGRRSDIVYGIGDHLQPRWLRRLHQLAHQCRRIDTTTQPKPLVERAASSTPLLDVSPSPSPPQQFSCALPLLYIAKEEAAAPQMEAPSGARASSRGQADQSEHNKELQKRCAKMPNYSNLTFPNCWRLTKN